MSPLVVKGLSVTCMGNLEYWSRIPDLLLGTFDSSQKRRISYPQVDIGCWSGQLESWYCVHVLEQRDGVGVSLKTIVQLEILRRNWNWWDTYINKYPDNISICLITSQESYIGSWQLHVLCRCIVRSEQTTNYAANSNYKLSLGGKNNSKHHHNRHCWTNNRRHCDSKLSNSAAVVTIQSQDGVIIQRWDGRT